MIIRILGEGQFTVDDAHVTVLNDLDDQLVLAVDADDAVGFALTLRKLLAAVGELGAAVPAEALLPSDLVLPAADTPLADVRALLRSDGLIPG
ncbi:PspA-associated protein PspAA [Nocardia sp. IFM 10818]